EDGIRDFHVTGVQTCALPSCVLLFVVLRLAAASGVLAALSGENLDLLLGIGAIYGGMAFAIYPIAVAHTNDFLPAEDAIAATGETGRAACGEGVELGGAL